MNTMNTSCKVGIYLQYGINKRCVCLTKPFTTQIQASPVEIEYENAKPYSKIPGPSVFKIMMGFLPGGRYRDLEPIDLHKLMSKEYGTIFRLPGFFGRNDTIFTYDPKDFETVFRTEGPWPYRREIFALDYFRRVVRPDLYKNIVGLVNDQGEAWGHMRSAVNPIMLKPRTVKAYIPAIDDVAQDFIARMKKISDEKQEMPANFGYELNKWSLESIAVIALEHRLGVISNEDDPESQKIIKSVKDLSHLCFKAEIMPPIWKYVKTPMFKQLMDAFNTMTDIAKKHVDNAIERISKGETKNMEDGDESVLEKLLKVNPDYASVIAMDMLLAGIDTTSTAVADLLYHLAKNPQKQEKLREEVMRILPNVDSKLTPTSINSIPYMRACLKESMRLTPPIPANLRTTVKDLVLQGYQIPKNTDVGMGSCILHLDESHFKKSTEFIPERWLSGDAIEGCPNRSDHPFAFLPFGFGARACVGKRVAEMEAFVIIFRILREFKVEWHYGPLKFVQSLIVTPTNDLKFKMIPLKECAPQEGNVHK